MIKALVLDILHKKQQHFIINLGQGFLNHSTLGVWEGLEWVCEWVKLNCAKPFAWITGPQTNLDFRPSAEFEFYGFGGKQIEWINLELNKYW